MGTVRLERWTAKRVLFGGYVLSARDALRVAVMEAVGIARIMTFETAFDAYPGIERLS